MSRPPRLVARTLAVAFRRSRSHPVGRVHRAHGRRSRPCSGDGNREARRRRASLYIARSAATARAAAAISTLAENPTLKAAARSTRRVCWSSRAGADLHLASIDAAAQAAERDALTALGTVALGGFVLAALGSLWLARLLTGPIDRLSGEIAMITAARDFGRMLPSTGTSRELNALAQAFNELLKGITTAEGGPDRTADGAERGRGRCPQTRRLTS